MSGVTIDLMKIVLNGKAKTSVRLMKIPKPIKIVPSLGLRLIQALPVREFDELIVGKRWLR